MQQDRRKEMNGRINKLVKAFEQIELFNSLQTNKEYTYYLEGLDTQVPVILEEVLELADALEDVDDVEILDGLADSLVTVLGAIKRAEKGGFDVLGALLAVCENNMLKYTFDYEQAVKWAFELEQKLGVEVVVFGDEKLYGVMRSDTGKILKPINHPKVSLDNFLPVHGEV